MTQLLPIAEAYTDGSCVKNPGGAGGWSAILVIDGKETELSGSEPESSNNRAELQGAILALEALQSKHQVVLTCDSEYVVKGATQWIHGWMRRGWKTATGDDVKNQDLWRRLAMAASRHEVHWKWVRGHVGHHYNERCDELAGRAADSHLPEHMRRTWDKKVPPVAPVRRVRQSDAEKALDLACEKLGAITGTAAQWKQQLLLEVRGS